MVNIDAVFVSRRALVLDEGDTGVWLIEREWFSGDTSRHKPSPNSVTIFPLGGFLFSLLWKFILAKPSIRTCGILMPLALSIHVVPKLYPETNCHGSSLISTLLIRFISLSMYARCSWSSQFCTPSPHENKSVLLTTKTLEFHHDFPLMHPSLESF